ncbi:hypothetical protein AB1E18_004322 [Capra hircus]
MTVDDHKSMRDQLDQKPNGERAKGTRGLHFVSSRKWYPAAVTLGVLCLGLLVTVILLILQLSQVSDLLKQQQANITHQENILEGQILAQRQSEKSSQESQEELKEMIETLAHKLDEKSKKLMELHRQNLNLQEVLKEAANYSGPCPQDWLWHEENCYQFSSGSFNWEKSQENCLSLDAHLLKINSTDELEFIQQMIAHSSFPFWTGLSMRKPSYSWLWEDGTPLMPHLFRIQGAVSHMYPSGTSMYLLKASSVHPSAASSVRPSAGLLSYSAVVLGERRKLSDAVSIQKLSLTMECQSSVENLDEDGYTQLDFSSRSITRRSVVSEKGLCAASSRWRLIAVTLGILCSVLLVITVVLSTLGIWRSSSGNNPLKSDSFPSRNKDNQSQPTQSSLEDSVIPTKALTTTGVFSSACPPNWITREDSCYLFNTLLDSWDGSKRRCFQLGSNLLKIDSSKELEFISRRVSSQPDHSFWIGLSRRRTEEPWLWEDGSTLLSNLFQIRSTVTEKDSSHNCAWIHVSDIYDQLCSVHSYSICEKKLSI